jgi:hypothetical protein
VLLKSLFQILEEFKEFHSFQRSNHNLTEEFKNEKEMKIKGT